MSPAGLSWKRAEKLSSPIGGPAGWKVLDGPMDFLCDLYTHPPGHLHFDLSGELRCGPFESRTDAVAQRSHEVVLDQVSLVCVSISAWACIRGPCVGAECELR